MGLDNKVSAERVHIGFFGLRNAGKSSLVNALTEQRLSLVSEVKGTTTDPVKKAMELLPLGPVVIIDTPGIDDEGELGNLRVRRAMETLDRTDIAVLVTTAGTKLTEAEQELLVLFAQKNIPYLIVYNKSDLCSVRPENPALAVSAFTGEGVYALKEQIAALAGKSGQEKPLVSDLVSAGEVAVLVTPIDAAAPKGRLILPQQQTLRELLDVGAIPVVCKETELKKALDQLAVLPKLVITDSKVFGMVDKIVPETVPLTSFSILFARYKGDLDAVVRGADALSELQDGDTILISEGCTHHRQCGDIGTQKLPALVRKYTGKTVEFSFTSGCDFPEDVRNYALIIHCGGCMLNEREMQSRLARAKAQDVPMTNYGTAIAAMNGILQRSLAPFANKP